MRRFVAGRSAGTTRSQKTSCTAYVGYTFQQLGDDWTRRKVCIAIRNNLPLCRL